MRVSDLLDEVFSPVLSVFAKRLSSFTLFQLSFVSCFEGVSSVSGVLLQLGGGGARAREGGSGGGSGGRRCGARGGGDAARTGRCVLHPRHVAVVVLFWL